MMKSTETIRTHKTKFKRTVKHGDRVKTVERVRFKRAITRRTVKGKPQGVVLYRGPSQIDGKPIVCVATNLARRSRNPKTGDLVQTYILSDNGEDPVQAAKTDGDGSVCGDCPHRPVNGKLGSCYVNLIQGPLNVYRAAKTGKYPTFNRKRHLRHFRGRMIRLGSYGDPAAVPLAAWKTVCDVADGWVGYTHAWRYCDPDYAKYCMASVETAAQRIDAMATGYRTFRVRLSNQPLEQGEFVCPASEEAGHRLTCDQCRACSGAKSGGRNATPVIVFHGSGIGGEWKLRRYEQTIDRLQQDERQRGLFPLALV